MPLERPQCLHIPPLYGGENAFIRWDSVDGADSYELDCQYDEPIESTALGQSWMHLEAGGLAWGTLDAKALSWNDLLTLPSGYPVYSGSGADAPGADDGRTWAMVGDADKSWLDIENAGLDWAGIAALPGTKRSWSAFDGLQLCWEDRDTESLTWNEIEALPPDAGAHRGHEVSISQAARSAYFRVRAKDGQALSSPYLTAVRHPVAAKESVAVSLLAGEQEWLQIDAGRARGLESCVFTVRYDPSRLKLEALEAVRETGMLKGLRRETVRRAGGSIRFRLEYPIEADDACSGLLALIRFSALKSGRSRVVLERSGETDKRAV